MKELIGERNMMNRTNDHKKIVTRRLRVRVKTEKTASNQEYTKQLSTRLINDPFHNKRMESDVLLAFLKQDERFRTRYRDGFYTYKSGYVQASHPEDRFKKVYLPPRRWHSLARKGSRFDSRTVSHMRTSLSNYSDHKYFLDFYAALAYFMKQKNVTQLMIAQEMNVSTTYISRIINKKETLTVNLVVCFCIILKLSPYYSRRLLSLAGFNIEENRKYSLYLLILNEHYNESLQYCDEIIDVLATDEEKREFKLVRQGR